MSDPYYPDAHDDEQDESMQFDQYDDPYDQTPSPPRRAQGQGSQPEWQSDNPNTQQDQWGQQRGGRNRQHPPQRDRMNTQDPDADARWDADGSGNQPNNRYPRASPQSAGIPDDIDADEDLEDWMDDPSSH